MGHPNDGHVNLVISSFNNLGNFIDKVKDLDETIVKVMWELKRLRKQRSDLRTKILSMLRKCKRVYVPQLFVTFSKGVEDKIELMDDCCFNESASLRWTLKQIASLRVDVGCEIDERVIMATKKRNVRSKTACTANGGSNSKANYKEKWKTASRYKRSINQRLNDKNVINVNKIKDDRNGSADATYYPMWCKDDPTKLIIRSSDKNEHDKMYSNLYNPGYYPNPFANYIERST